MKSMTIHDLLLPIHDLQAESDWYMMGEENDEAVRPSSPALVATPQQTPQPQPHASRPPNGVPVRIARRSPTKGLSWTNAVAGNTIEENGGERLRATPSGSGGRSSKDPHALPQAAAVGSEDDKASAASAECKRPSSPEGAVDADAECAEGKKKKSRGLMRKFVSWSSSNFANKGRRSSSGANKLPLMVCLSSSMVDPSPLLVK